MMILENFRIRLANEMIPAIESEREMAGNFFLHRTMSNLKILQLIQSSENSKNRSSLKSRVKYHTSIIPN
jgi:hypothetical protein